jgi:hypothetical protein
MVATSVVKRELREEPSSEVRSAMSHALKAHGRRRATASRKARPVAMGIVRRANRASRVNLATNPCSSQMPLMRAELLR